MGGFIIGNYTLKDMTQPLVKDWKLHRNIILYAFNYCLGRHSYAPSEFIENVKANEQILSEFEINSMIKDIEWHLDKTTYENGFKDIEYDWRGFLQWLKEKLK